MSLPVDYDDVLAAAERLRPYVASTPLLESAALNARCGGRVLLKAENLQRVGAFKFRGAYNAVMQSDAARYPGGVVACSSGNHAQGIAEAARLAGKASVIVMPADAPAIKIARTRAFGGETVLYNRATDDRDGIAKAISGERQMEFISPFDDVRVIAGQGTVGLEIMDECERRGLLPDAILVPCSGGGLTSGIAVAATSRHAGVKVYAVEPEGFDDYKRSLEAGHKQRNDKLDGTICDALGMIEPGDITFEISRQIVAGGIAISDQMTKDAMRFAFTELKLVLEPGGAIALAAILSGAFDARGKTVAVVLSGGNVDPAQFAGIICA